MNRRHFLSTSSKVACVCALGTISGIISSCSGPTEPTPQGDTTGIELEFDLANEAFVALQVEGGSIVTDGNEIDSSGLLLLRTGETVKAFTRRCTHQGVQLVAFSDGISVCSYGHGAQFDSNGLAVSGPATEPLKTYDTDLNGNILTIFGG